MPTLQPVTSFFKKYWLTLLLLAVIIVAQRFFPPQKIYYLPEDLQHFTDRADRVLLYLELAIALFFLILFITRWRKSAMVAQAILGVILLLVCVYITFGQAIVTFGLFLNRQHPTGTTPRYLLVGYFDGRKSPDNLLFHDLTTKEITSNDAFIKTAIHTGLDFNSRDTLRLELHNGLLGFPWYDDASFPKKLH